MTAACPDRRGDLGVAALDPGSVDPELAHHLEGCAACTDELRRLREAAAMLPLAPSAPDATGPDGEAVDAVLARAVDQLRREHRRRVVRRRTAIAAVVLVTVGVVAALRTGSGDDGLEGERIAFTRAAAGAEGEAVVAPSGAGSVVEVIAEGLEPGAVYALWLSSADGRRTPAGTFKVGDDGTVQARLPCGMAATDADRVWATDETGDVALDGWAE